MIHEPTSPRVLIIILCYNGINDTIACLHSLQNTVEPHADILIVDNASADGTLEQIRMHFPGVALIETGANLGFAAGNNVGVQYALQHQYDYTLLLNNDTEVSPDFLERLLAVIESDPSIGVVGPTIYYHERPDLIWSAGGSIDWINGRTSMRTSDVELGHPPMPNDVAFVTGCALLVRCSAIVHAGMLDERFFMYFEEAEWCVRIARTGLRIVHVPDSRILHKIPLNARADKEYLAYYMTRNRLLFLQLTGASPISWANALVEDMRTLLSLSIRPKWRARAGRTGMRMALRDYWRGRFGMMPHQ